MKSHERLSRVRNAICAVPWLIQDAALELILSIVEKNLAEDKIVFEGDGSDNVAYEVRGGVAIVPLMGAIFPRANIITRKSNATSAETFRQNFCAAIADPEVNAVIIKTDSPGGQVSGIFEAATKVFQSRAIGKPIIALCEGTMASAAYLIASQADAVYATEASMVGSIGIITQVQNSDRQDANAGLETKTFTTGPYKGMGTSKMTAAQELEMQAMVDDFFGRFKDAIVRARPTIDIESVSTGKVWIGKAAQDAGLVDGITTMEDLLAELSASQVS